MIASAHFAAGIVIGLSSDHLFRGRVTRATTAFAVAVMVHLLMDAVPHADYHLFPSSATPYFVVIEAIVVAALATVLLRDRLTPHWRSSMAAGLLGSALPDAKFIAPQLLSHSYALRVEHYGNMLHGPFHRGDISPFGMMTQVLCAILLLASFVAFPRTRA